ncbi:hypothetical protein CPLU01_05212 [Colletotrichum plurivorum]|uniref:Uncharacterized protein n=1 Tax=Colletotrichum plurivorum TaxID=2175906 RepID=A0A8H6KLW3_9PEZI|nr:hypothetical protein CPLU01_05212 [Colletotrichum plurivorum]
MGPLDRGKFLQFEQQTEGHTPFTAALRAGRRDSWCSRLVYFLFADEKRCSQSKYAVHDSSHGVHGGGCRRGSSGLPPSNIVPETYEDYTEILLPSVEPSLSSPLGDSKRASWAPLRQQGQARMKHRSEGKKHAGVFGKRTAPDEVKAEGERDGFVVWEALMEMSFLVKFCFLCGIICRERSALMGPRRWTGGWISKPRRKLSGRSVVVYLHAEAGTRRRATSHAGTVLEQASNETGPV